MRRPRLLGIGGNVREGPGGLKEVEEQVLETLSGLAAWREGDAAGSVMCIPF